MKSKILQKLKKKQNYKPLEKSQSHEKKIPISTLLVDKFRLLKLETIKPNKVIT